MLKKIAFGGAIAVVSLWWAFELFFVWIGASYMGQVFPHHSGSLGWYFVPPVIGIGLITASVLIANMRIRWGTLIASTVLAVGSLPWFAGFFVAYMLSVIGTA